MIIIIYILLLVVTLRSLYLLRYEKILLLRIFSAVLVIVGLIGGTAWIVAPYRADVNAEASIAMVVFMIVADIYTISFSRMFYNLTFRSIIGTIGLTVTAIGVIFLSTIAVLMVFFP